MLPDGKKNNGRISTIAIAYGKCGMFCALIASSSQAGYIGMRTSS
jgi:hypothetical protein